MKNQTVCYHLSLLASLCELYVEEEGKLELYCEFHGKIACRYLDKIAFSNGFHTTCGQNGS